MLIPLAQAVLRSKLGIKKRLEPISEALKPISTHADLPPLITGPSTTDISAPLSNVKRVEEPKKAPFQKIQDAVGFVADRTTFGPRGLVTISQFLNADTPEKVFQNENLGRFRSGLNSVVNSFGRSFVEDMPKTAALLGGGVGNKLFEGLTGEEGNFDPVESDVFRLGEQLGNSLNAIFPTNPEFQDELLTKVLQGAGSLASFLVPGTGISKGVLATRGLISAGQAASEYENARSAGSTPDEAYKVWLLNLPLAGIEIIPVTRAFSRMDRISGGGVKRVLNKKLSKVVSTKVAKRFSRFGENPVGRVMIGGALNLTEESLQEGVSGVGQNIIAGATYDETRKALEGVGEQMLVGGILGGGLGSVTTYSGLAREIATEEFDLAEIRKSVAWQNGFQFENGPRPGTTDSSPALPQPLALSDRKAAEATIAALRSAQGADLNFTTKVKESFRKMGFDELADEVEAMEAEFAVQAVENSEDLIAEKPGIILRSNFEIEDVGEASTSAIPEDGQIISDDILVQSTRIGDVNSNGSHFGLPGTQYEGGKAHNLAGAKIANTQDPNTLKSIIDNIDRSKLDKAQIKLLDEFIEEGYEGGVPYSFNDKIPISESAKDLGYDGLSLNENQDLPGEQSTVFVWNSIPKGEVIGDSEVGGQKLLRVHGPDGVVGSLIYTQEGSSFVIGSSLIEEEFRGKGLGSKMYKALADKALEEGFTLKSGKGISDDAKRVWDSLKGAGYKVTESEGVLTLESGPDPTTFETEFSQIPPPQDIDDLKSRTNIPFRILNRIRHQTGLDSLPTKEKQSLMRAIEKAEKSGLGDHIDSFASAQILDPVALEPFQQMALQAGIAEAAEQFEVNMIDSFNSMEKGNDAAGARARKFAYQHQATVDKLSEALEASDSKAGTSLGFINQRRKADTSLSRIVKETESVQGGPLSKTQEKLFVKLYQEFKRLEVLTDEKSGAAQTEMDAIAESLAEDIIIDASKASSEAADQLKIKADIELIKEQLTMLGFRVNDVGGLSTEAAFLVSKLAKKYVELGSRRLDDVVRKISSDMPDLSRRDIVSGIANLDINVIKSAEKIVKQKMRLVEQQASLVDTIEKKLDKGRDASDELKQLQALYPRTLSNKESIEKADKIIKALRRKLARPIKPTKEKIVEPITGELRLKQDEISDLRAILRLKQQTADYKQQFKSKVFKVKKKDVVRRTAAERAKRPSPATKAWFEAKVSRDLAFSKIRTAQAKAGKLSKASLLREIPRLPRAFLATADISGVMRQGFLVNAMTPTAILPSLAKSLRAGVSRRSSISIDLGIKAHPNFKFAEAQRLYHADLSTGLSQSEELFTTKLIDKLPNMSDVADNSRTLGQRMRSLPAALISETMQASNRQMVTYLNLMRFAAFNQFIEVAPEHQTLDPEGTKVGRAFANFVNQSSGRGTLKPASVDILSTFMFAPRFSFSRFQVLNPVQFLTLMQNKTTRKLLAKQMFNIALFGGTVLSLAEAGGAIVGDDPEDSDFGKIIVSNTRFDIWGGMQQPISLIYRIANGSLKAHEITEGDSQDLWDLALNFASYKLSPPITIAGEFLQKKTIVGQPVETVETLMNGFIPLFAQDTAENAKIEEDAGLAAAVMLTTISGIGVSTFENPLKHGRLKPLFKRANTSINPTSFSRAGIDDDELKNELKLMFQSIVARKLHAKAAWLERQSDTRLKEAIQEIGAESREEMRTYVNPKYSPEFISKIRKQRVP